MQEKTAFFNKLLAFAHAYARAFYGGILLVIEEPEAHLRPLAQRWLARKIREMCKQGLQVVITTHSPAFVDIEGLEGLVLVRKEAGGATVVRQMDRNMLLDHCVKHGASRERAKPDNILPFYAGHATEEIMSGFFAKAIVFVEGATEVLALPVYLNRVGLDVAREGIAVMAVMGKGNLAKWWRLFTAYDIPVYVVFDNDAKDDSSGAHRSDVLRALGVDHAEAKEAIHATDMLVRPQYCVFGRDFDQCLRELFEPAYQALEEEARSLFGESKPLKARYVAERLNASELGEGMAQFQALAEAVKTLVGRRSPGEVGENTFNEEVPF